MPYNIELPKSGLFMTLEGGEGSGKSTMIHYLKEAFEDLGHEVVIIREPGGTAFSEELRSVFMSHNDLSPETSVHLINAQRQHNLESFIIPNLEKGRVVLADRFTASTLIYQGLLNESFEKVSRLMVDVDQTTIFVDVKPEVGLQRIAKNNRSTNRFDELELEKHQLIYEGYHLLATAFPYKYWNFIINGDQSLEAIKHECIQIAHQSNHKIK